MDKKYFKDYVNREDRDKMVETIIKRSDALRGRTTSILDVSVQFLTVSNLGGLAGSLTYLAANPTHTWFMVSAGCFSLGLTLVGIAFVLMHRYF